MSTAPIKEPTPRCAVCGLTSPDLVPDGVQHPAAEAAERLGAKVGLRCPDPDRCRRVIKGLPLSDDRKWGDVKKFDIDELPDPPPPNYTGEKPPPRGRIRPNYAHAKGEPQPPKVDEAVERPDGSFDGNGFDTGAH